MLVELVVDDATALLYLTGWRAPKAFAALATKLPAAVPAQVGEGLLSLKLDLAVAPEGHRRDACPGEVVYWPPASSVLVVLSDRCVKIPSPASVLGFVARGLNSLRRLADGRYEARLRLTDRVDVDGPLVHP